MKDNNSDPMATEFAKALLPFVSQIAEYCEANKTRYEEFLKSYEMENENEH